MKETLPPVVRFVEFSHSTFQCYMDTIHEIWLGLKKIKM